MATSDLPPTAEGTSNLPSTASPVLFEENSVEFEVTICVRIKNDHRTSCQQNGQADGNSQIIELFKGRAG